MLSTAVQKDISRYKSKVVGKMTGRALLCVSGAIASAIGSALWLYFVLGVNPSDFGFVMMAVCLPFWLFGFFKPAGMEFEKWLPRWFCHRFSDNKVIYRSFAKMNGFVKDLKLEQIDIKRKPIKGIEAYECEVCEIEK